MSDSLQLHGLQHTRPSCLSTTPEVYSNSSPVQKIRPQIHTKPNLVYCAFPGDLPQVSTPQHLLFVVVNISCGMWTLRFRTWDPDQGWNLAPFMEERSLSQGTTREVPHLFFFFFYWRWYLGWRAFTMQFSGSYPVFLSISHVNRRYEKVKVLVPQSCPTFCNPMDCSPPGLSVHGITDVYDSIAIFLIAWSSIL